MQKATKKHSFSGTSSGVATSVAIMPPGSCDCSGAESPP